MFDSYEHTLTRQGRFVAGYKHCDVTRGSMGTYLFTTLRLLRVLDYVSGMTDSYAVSLYQKLKGISL